MGRKSLALAGMLLLALLAGRAQAFTVEDIELEGLQRIEPGTVFTYLPVNVGDELDPSRSDEVLGALYDTGFFSDVELRRRANVLVVKLTERPAIASIDFDGNEDIDDDALTDALKGVGIVKGRVFNRSILERLENELVQQYFARGKYSVQVNTQVEDLARNRVAIMIDISEGAVAKIQRVNIVGNQSFDERELTDDFDSGIPAWYAFFSSRDQYSKQKLSGDLEKLRSFYLDRGYLKFNIDSTQVSITPDRKDIDITINVEEGQQYTVDEVKLAGELIVPEQELRERLKIAPGDTFSRAEVVNSTEEISQRLGDEGYAFATVNPLPEVDQEDKTVSLTFFVDPGQRVYVRRIKVRGNESTADQVYRRELRQLEGGYYSRTKIELSRRRLQRLPYVESVEVDTQRVPGVDDMVDVEFSVKERLAGNFSIGAGFSQSQGILFNTSLSQENFLGTGRRVAIRFDNSSFNTVYQFQYNNPYYTVDGISRGFTFNYTRTRASEADISDFNANQFGATLNYGIPLTEVDTVRLRGGYEGVDVDTTSNSPTEIFDFIDANGDSYDDFVFQSSFIHDTRNRTVFADKGNLQRLGLEVAVPGGDLKYFKTDYRNRVFIPFTDDLTLSLNGQVSYGDSYGDTTDLPFFQKYFAGGFSTVRGYDSNSLGPRDSFDEPFGGDFRVISNAELIFPPPIEEVRDNVRLSVFFDAGNVFADAGDFDVGELRTSVGVGSSWITPVGALTFSLAQALNDEPGDDTQIFQFNIGTLF